MKPHEIWLNALDLPGWEIDHYTATNNELKMVLWIANGVSMCRPYDSRGPCFNWWWKRKIYNKVMALKNKTYISAMGKLKGTP